MRVLHVIPSLDPDTGGPARSAPDLCRALRAAGVDVTLYTFVRPGAKTSISTDSETFPIEQFVPLPGSRQIPTMAFYRRIRRDIRQFHLAHLHSLWNPAIGVAALACRRAGAPYLLSPLGMLQDRAVRRKRTLKTIYYWLSERRTIAGARALHFLTKAEAQDSRRFLNGTKPFIVLPSGVDSSIADRVGAGRFRRSYPDLEGRRILLYLGRLHWSKGLELQAQALALLVRDFPDLMWVLVGPDDGEWSRISNRVRKNDLKRHVLWTGPLPQERCFEALTDSEMLLLTSRHEAQSLAINEALAIGVPLVVTDTVPFDEIKEWGAGRVVPWDAERLAAEIADVLVNPEQAQEMRAAGRRLVSERRAWPKLAEAMVSAYREILAPESGSTRQEAYGLVQRD